MTHSVGWHMRGCILGGFCLVLYGLTGNASAREIKVEPSASGEPVLANALAAAAEGDTVRISKGVYRETITLSKGIHLVGEEGAILDPSQPFAGPWRAAPEVGPGVYRTTVERKPRSLLLENTTECLVENNRIFRGAYEDWTPVDTSRERYEVWQLHKLAGFYDRVGIDLVRAGTNNRIHANHIWKTFDSGGVCCGRKMLDRMSNRIGPGTTPAML